MLTLDFLGRKELW